MYRAITGSDRLMRPLHPKLSIQRPLQVLLTPDNGGLVRIHDWDEAINVVGGVYCPHSIEPIGRPHAINVDLKVTRVADQSVVYLRYSAPVVVDAERFPNLLLMMSASSGAASVTQDGHESLWRAGQTMPLSPGRQTLLRFDHAFAQTSLRVDVDRLERICSALLGYPLERPLAFKLQPLAPEFEAVWQDAIKMVCGLAPVGATMPKVAVDSLNEFLLSTLLCSHPHNYSRELARPIAPATPRLIAAAKEMFCERAEAGTTVADVARELGVSVRTLQAGFQKTEQTTPSAFLRKVRLEAAHRILTTGTGRASVTDVALRLGFTHPGRFSADYRAAFGELPFAALRRYRQR